MENRLRWFGHVEKRLVDFLIKRVNQMERNQTTREREKPRKTIREVIKKDLERNQTTRGVGLFIYVITEFHLLRKVSYKVTHVALYNAT